MLILQLHALPGILPCPSRAQAPLLEKQKLSGSTQLGWRTSFPSAGPNRDSLAPPPTPLAPSQGFYCKSNLSFSGDLGIGISAEGKRGVDNKPALSCPSNDLGLPGPPWKPPVLVSKTLLLGCNPTFS